MPAPATGLVDNDVQVLSVETSTHEKDISSLLKQGLEITQDEELKSNKLAQEQREDSEILIMIQYLEQKLLPECTIEAC